jgi:hypothetical protein
VFAGAVSVVAGAVSVVSVWGAACAGAGSVTAGASLAAGAAGSGCCSGGALVDSAGGALVASGRNESVSFFVGTEHIHGRKGVVFRVRVADEPSTPGGYIYHLTLLLCRPQ